MFFILEIDIIRTVNEQNYISTPNNDKNTLDNPFNKESIFENKLYTSCVPCHF